MMDIHDPSTEHSTPNTPGSAPLHEPSNVNVKIVVAFACVLFIGSLTIMIGVQLLLHYLMINHARVEVPLSPLADPNPVPPAPRLQVIPGQDVQELHAREEHVLHNYRWLDHNAGTVAIPIDRAIELLAQRGVPTREEAPKDH